MCAGPFRPSRPAPPPPDPVVEQEQAEQKAQATEKAKTARSERLAETLADLGGVRRRGGGRGRRSLITGSRGGMGYYNEYLD